MMVNEACFTYLPGCFTYLKFVQSPIVGNLIIHRQIWDE